ncbi:MAG: endoflagellar hook capping protein [Leptospiraceae bacterium]|nr:endoflagellar hook capping protein [Leptospiraceae bacterium]MCP5494535.1 endoflagellar hook capping protein [Leptospiraceae bacterium]
MPSKSIESNSESIKQQYLRSDKKFNVQKHLENLEKEEKSGLKGIEIRNSSQQLGKDDFLKILITQLSSQDPTSPLKDQDFIAQMAQFSSLEQMKNISSGISRMEAKQNYTLVGKYVSGPDFVTGEPVNGIAGALFVDGDGKAFLRVNGRTIEADKINFVSDPSALSGSLPVEDDQGVKTNPNSVENDTKKEWDYPGKKNSGKNNPYSQ